MAETGDVWRAAVKCLKAAAAYAGEHRVVVALDGIPSSYPAYTPS
jgi:hypothetical protein